MDTALYKNVPVICLQEYGYEYIKKLAYLYNTVVKGVIEDIKNVMNAFRNALESNGGSPFVSIISTLINVIRDLPGTVMNLSGIGRDIIHLTGQFADMPPVVDKVNDLALKVTRLFSDIKTDVMEMYNVRQCI